MLKSLGNEVEVAWALRTGLAPEKQVFSDAVVDRSAEKPAYRYQSGFDLHRRTAEAFRTSLSSTEVKCAGEGVENHLVGSCKVAEVPRHHEDERKIKTSTVTARKIFVTDRNQDGTS